MSSPLVVPFVLCLDSRRQRSIRLLGPWAPLGAPGAMAAVSDLMLRRPCINVSNRSIRRASWRQREIVPVRCVMACCVWCVVNTLCTCCSIPLLLASPLQPALLDFPTPPRAACHVPSMTERLSQQAPRELRARLPGCPPPPYRIGPAHDMMPSPAPAACLIDMLLLVSLPGMPSRVTPRLCLEPCCRIEHRPGNVVAG